jgi:hypothetical protein
MIVFERELQISHPPGGWGGLSHFEEVVINALSESQMPLRFVVPSSGPEGFKCELGVIEGGGLRPQNSIFRFVRRKFEDTSRLNVVFIVPTGIGAEIGGFAGDATPSARLIASVCDCLITHPNVVSASDINELPENGWFVEGSILCRLLMGTIGLHPVRANRILVLIDENSDPVFVDAAINSVNAARATYGLSCSHLLCFHGPLKMEASYMPSGRASGRIEGLDSLIEIINVRRSEFDAIAISSRVDSAQVSMAEYFENSSNLINPWGGVEALLTHAISTLLDVPSAHCPAFGDRRPAEVYPPITDPRIAAEAVSTTFLNCILKGLQRSPRVVTDQTFFARDSVLTAADVSCVVIPDGCIGLPVLAALEQGIKVIAVRENRNAMRNGLANLPWASDQFYVVDNYLEAAGLLQAFKTGLSLESLRRPLARLTGEVRIALSESVPADRSTH